MMNNSEYNWLKSWSDLINKKAEPEDFWIETPFGEFKNPKFIPGEKSKENEINITIQYEEWKKIKI